MKQSQFQTAMMLGAAADRLLVHEFPGLTPNPDTFSNKMQKEYGWDLLGKGFYGAVFDHPKQYDLVFKVGTDLDDGWLSYAAYCMRNWYPGSPLLEVHEIAIFERCYVAIFERLENWRGVPGITSTMLCDHRRVVEGTRGLFDGKYDDVAAAMRRELGTPYDLHQNNIMIRCGHEIVWTDPYSRMDGSESYKHYTRGHRVERERTTLAAVSPRPAVRSAQEDQMLRLNPFHDNRALAGGVQKPLLSGRGPWWVRPPLHDIDIAAIAAAAARPEGIVGGGVKRSQRQIAEGLLQARQQLQAHVDLARKERHQRKGGLGVRDRVQPFVKPDDYADTRTVAAGRMDRAATRNRRTEIHHARALHDVLFGDFRAIEKRVLANVRIVPRIDRDGGLIVGYQGRQARQVIGDTRHVHERPRNEAGGDGAGQEDRRVA